MRGQNRLGLLETGSRKDQLSTSLFPHWATVSKVFDFVLLNLMNNPSSYIQEFMVVTVFGYLISFNIDFYDFTSPFSP